VLIVLPIVFLHKHRTIDVEALVRWFDLVFCFTAVLLMLILKRNDIVNNRLPLVLAILVALFLVSTRS
jgi:EAL domain-containing protein (putative c-di-GMP-specific phosphodiesterase class I)